MTAPFRVFAHRAGNYFFLEIADLIHSALVRAGQHSERCDERHPLVDAAAANIIIAPHEFFVVGRRAPWGPRAPARNLVLLNTEKPGTAWFRAGAAFLGWATAIWDMDRSSAEWLAAQGYPASFLPLGYVAGFAPFDEVVELSARRAGGDLPPAIRSGAFLSRSFGDRPIDALFIGAISPRRERAFAQLEPALRGLHCRFHFWHARGPAIVGKTTAMDTPTAIGLAQRSKIVLNVRTGDVPYFEWHRIVHHGIWQRALVVTEPSPATEPFAAGRDFLAVPLDQMAGQVRWLVSSNDGRRRAVEIIDRAHLTLTTETNLAGELLRRLAPYGVGDSRPG